MMAMLTTLLLIAGAGVLLWFTFTTIKKNPQAFHADNVNRSFFTLGILALLLIGLIALLVLFLKHA
jgi:hypothetical protein